MCTTDIKLLCDGYFLLFHPHYETSTESTDTTDTNVVLMVILSRALEMKMTAAAMIKDDVGFSSMLTRTQEVESTDRNHQHKYQL